MRTRPKRSASAPANQPPNDEVTTVTVPIVPAAPVDMPDTAMTVGTQLRSFRQISNVAEKANKDAARSSKSPTPISELAAGFVHLKACSTHAAEHVDANDRRSGRYTELTRDGGRGFASPFLHRRKADLTARPYPLPGTLVKPARASDVNGHDNRPRYYKSDSSPKSARDRGYRHWLQREHVESKDTVEEP